MSLYRQFKVRSLLRCDRLNWFSYIKYLQNILIHCIMLSEKSHQKRTMSYNLSVPSATFVRFFDANLSNIPRGSIWQSFALSMQELMKCASFFQFFLFAQLCFWSISLPISNIFKLYFLSLSNHSLRKNFIFLSGRK